MHVRILKSKDYTMYKDFMVELQKWLIACPQICMKSENQHIYWKAKINRTKCDANNSACVHALHKEYAKLSPCITKITKIKSEVC